MGRPSKKATAQVGGVTPQHEHNAKLIQEDIERKATKPTVESVSYETVVSSFHRQKYHQVTRMSNGNVWRKSISKQAFEAATANGG